METNQMVYKYRFNRQVSLQEVEDSLMLAELAAECLHGRATMKLDAAFCIDRLNRACVVDGSCKIGQDIACIFTGFLAKEFGEEAFRVERVEGCIPPEANRWQRIPGLFNKRELKQMKEPGKQYYQDPRGKDDWGLEVFAVFQRSLTASQDGARERHE